MKKKNGYRKGDLVEVTIDDITDLGFGVGRVDGVVIFISDTVPGDKVEATLIKVNASYLVGKAVRYIVLSDMRCEGRCDEEKCHSCAYKSISYEDELKKKEDSVRRLFQPLGIEVAPIVGSPEEKRYRNKAQYPVSQGQDGGYNIGFYMPKSHRVTPISDCNNAPRIFAKIIEVVREYLEEESIPAYNEETGIGVIRHIYLRASSEGEVLCTLVATTQRLPNEEGLVGKITRAFPEVVGILVNHNPEATNVVLGIQHRVIWGRNYIVDTLAGVRLNIPYDSFYQVNHDAAELLYAKAKSLAGIENGDTIVDLYCGVGSIGLSMARDAGELYGIEIVPSAIFVASGNAEQNGIANAHFYLGDAENSEELLKEAEADVGHKIKPDVIILDPPRKGCDKKLLDYVSQLSPKRIVYISCNPKTLARDVAIMFEAGFTPGEVTPVDLFPGTGHVESVVCLTRRLDVDMRR